MLGLLEADEKSCWGNGFSRPTCCLEDPIVPCFLNGSGFTAVQCCARPYDMCFMIALQQGDRWRAEGATCDEFVRAGDAALSRDCLTWWQGDTLFEQTVVTDAIEAGFARCFHAVVWRRKKAQQQQGEAETATAAPAPFAPPKGQDLKLGVCVPKACGEEDIIANPFLFMDLYRLSSGKFPPEAALVVNLTEVWSWRVLGERIDFVIAGFPNSGSSTLGETIAAHPEVELIRGVDDDHEIDVPSAQSNDLSWETWLCAELLPRRWVEEVFPERTSRKVRGIKNPLLAYSDRCLWGLARASVKVIVIVRDPIEWLLSVLGHDVMRFGYGLVDYMPGHPGFFGRDHARFGTILSRISELWPPEKALALELEHFRQEDTTRLVLRGISRFLGLSPFPGRVDGKPGATLKYDKGLGTSSSKWSASRLCTVGQVFNFHVVAEGLQKEYAELPKVLAWMGVPELGVSTTLLRGGVFARNCDVMHQIPSEGAALSGWPERAAAEKLIRVDWRGELGYEFEPQVPIYIGALGCGVGRGPLKRATHMTLWESRLRQPIWVGSVGPASQMLDGFAFTKPIEPPVILHPKQVYALTVQAQPGLGISSAGHSNGRLLPSLAVYKGAVFSRAAWVFPSERDDNASELVYVNLVAVEFAGR